MNEIILVKGKMNLGSLKKESIKNDTTIIAFDYSSHKLLNELNIKHEIVEKYFFEKDISFINDFSIELTKSWYKNEKISKFLEYKKINLGSLLELELTSYFFTHLKKIIGLKNILEIEKPTSIKSYGLRKYVESICKDENIKLQFVNEDEEEELFFDKIEIPINLLFLKKKLSISRTNYFRIKECFDKICNLFFKIDPKKDFLKNNKSILLLDFNTKLYQDFIKSFKNSDTNIILLNQRKPAIWDFESLKIIRDSNCRVLFMKKFENAETKMKKLKDKDKLNENLDSLWKNEETLKKIFSINNDSFWDIIQNNFKKIISDRFNESITRLVLLNEVFDQLKIRLILDWAHTGVEEKEIGFFANNSKIPIYCLQHGIMTLNPSFEKYHHLMPVLPSNNSTMCIWGKIMEDYLIEHKIDSKQIMVVGSPRHDRFFRNESVNNNTILIASNLFFHANFQGNDIRAIERFELFLKETLTYIKKNSDKQPIIKLHETEYFEVSKIVKKIDPTIPIFKFEDILDLLESCDILISLNYSTILLDALILNKPTLVFLPEKQNFEEEEIIKQKAVLPVSNISELDIKLNQILFDENIRKELIKNGKQFVDKYFAYQGNSCEFLTELLLEKN